MPSIFEWKEQETPETPLLLFEVRFTDGAEEQWSTHTVEFDGKRYEGRVLKHNTFEFRSYSEEGLDAAARISLTLANADSYLSQVERQHGFKGASLRVRFLFFNLKEQTAASEAQVVFLGTGSTPEEITESTFRVSFSNRLSPQRISLPEVQIEAKCPWMFPRSRKDREAALTGGGRGRFGRFYRCGYSADVEGGVGNLDGDAPFTSCAGTRAACQQRGMFDRDLAGRVTARFGGCEFVPASYLVRGYGEKTYRAAQILTNEARYSDVVPVIYGTAWCQPRVVFARNDGNLTHIEALIGMGEINRVLRVVANDIEIPEGQAGANMTVTGWYNVVSVGTREGAFNLDFVGADGSPVGDPHGSMAVLSVVLPNRISDGRSMPRIQALVEGMKLDQWTADGDYVGYGFTANPAWIILDLLRRCGWGTDEVDLRSFAQVAAYCDEDVEVAGESGETLRIKRRRTNLVIDKRRSAADLIRGIRNGAGLYLSYGTEGRLKLGVEGTFAQQQPEKPPGSNAAEPYNGGWPAYEFGDGQGGLSGILLNEDGAPRIRIWSRGMADTPNRFTLEFQNELNGYRQDSLFITDQDDVEATGTEITAPFLALGVPNVYQAAELCRAALNRQLRGNLYIDFATSVRGYGLKPGDLITVTYGKEGWQRKPFRVIRAAPDVNYETLMVTAQAHDDEWYGHGTEGVQNVRGEDFTGTRIPRPLVGALPDGAGGSALEIEERTSLDTDGTGRVTLRVRFHPPSRPMVAAAGSPVLSLDADVIPGEGTLAAGHTYYYALSSIDATGCEGRLSFLVRVEIPHSAGESAVRLKGLRFGPGTASFHVYRGTDPLRLLRVAECVPVAMEFTDRGEVAAPVGPPDPNYDHANFYWRLERLPETTASIFGPDQIGSEILEMVPGEHTGRAVRITRGKGAGQERAVQNNTEKALSVTRPWDEEPDGTSSFVVADSGWVFGATTQGEEAEFETLNRADAIVEIIGRSANVWGEECDQELSPFARWRIGGAAGADEDRGAPPAPTFGLALAGKGNIEVSGIGFPELTNTRSVTCGTLTLWFWNELNGGTPLSLEAAISGEEEFLRVSGGAVGAGDLIQVDQELMQVREILNGSELRIGRGSHGTERTSHAAGSAVYRLERKVSILPFPKGFFGSPSSGSYAATIRIPNARVAAAELYVTNARGDSSVTQRSYCHTEDSGLRTGCGGQLLWQAEGWVAIDDELASPVAIEARTAVRDVYAFVQEAPQGGEIVVRVLVNGEEYCVLAIPEGAKVSNAVSGFGKPALEEGAQVHVQVIAAPQGAGTSPGRDLCVAMRF